MSVCSQRERKYCMPEPDPILSVIVCLWCIVLGACVGSFLNVFVYRLPRRKSLLHPPSHCPVCGHLIRWHDNVPMFGWIKLRGKCRDCQSPISVRYPCVEGFCAALFGGIFVLLERLFDLPIELLGGLTLFGSLVGAAVLAACLIVYDKNI